MTSNFIVRDYIIGNRKKTIILGFCIYMLLILASPFLLFYWTYLKFIKPKEENDIVERQFKNFLTLDNIEIKRVEYAEIEVSREEWKKYYKLKTNSETINNGIKNKKFSDFYYRISLGIFLQEFNNMERPSKSYLTFINTKELTYTKVVKLKTFSQAWKIKSNAENEVEFIVESGEGYERVINIKY
jgi:hypothetical protein